MDIQFEGWFSGAWIGLVFRRSLAPLVDGVKVVEEGLNSLFRESLFTAFVFPLPSLKVLLTIAITLQLAEKGGLE